MKIEKLKMETLNFWSSERNEIYFDCRVVTKVSEAKN